MLRLGTMQVGISKPSFLKFLTAAFVSGLAMVALMQYCIFTKVLEGRLLLVYDV